MADVALAFFWHQHQPYYPDDVSGENPMPWVRLHGVKDYYGMALHLLEVPEMKCTINLVPSMLLQLQAYTDRGATDRFLQVSRLPADSLTEVDALFLLDNFFMANPDQMVRPYPRYADLHQRRGAGQNTAKEALRRFQDRDLRDLQVWFNLTWIHPLAFDLDPGLKSLLEKGKHFSEQEKHWVLDKHLDILRQVIPLHKKLVETGQVELTTTPYYHPILPLLFDKKLAREAMPDVKLPRYTGGYPEDAVEHVRRAVEQHEQIFGEKPRGMWPSEGSVCQAMVPLLAEHGIRWIATDEEILAASTHGFVSRDSKGHVRNPDRMYRPYRVIEGGHAVNIVFRDHALSDLIGFHYQRSDPHQAAEHLLGCLYGIGQASGHGECLVSIILDGENCWEHYNGGGVPFLRALYQKCTSTPGVRPVKIGQYLDDSPPRDTLPHLFAGSWISHNFAIWVGHEEDNTAWDALHRAREHLKQRQQQGHVPADKIKQAWDEIYIAEGSDWFWWYGDDHSSAQDDLFDFLFRRHVQNVYVLLGDSPPPELAKPINRRSHQKAIHSMPRAFLDVKIDGRQTFFEWLAAGTYVCQNERGTMAMVTRGPLKELFFGFDLEALLIRIDCDTPAKSALAEFDLLRVGFVEPAGWEVQIDQPGRSGVLPKARVLHNNTAVEPVGVEAGIDQVAEMSIPFALLGVKVDQPVQFFVELVENKQGRDRAPREGTIGLTCPSPDFEQIMWDV